MVCDANNRSNVGRKRREMIIDCSLAEDVGLLIVPPG